MEKNFQPPACGGEKPRETLWGGKIAKESTEEKPHKGEGYRAEGHANKSLMDGGDSWKEKGFTEKKKKKKRGESPRKVTTHVRGQVKQVCGLVGEERKGEVSLSLNARLTQGPGKIRTELWFQGNCNAKGEIFQKQG